MKPIVIVTMMAVLVLAFFQPVDGQPLRPATPSISVSNSVHEALKGQMKLKVLSGTYRLINGTVLLTGSDIFVKESWMTFPEGLVIKIGAEGATLKGTAYSEGTRLRVNEKGNLKRVK